tara:strand:+ start:520 stop:1041 length:522 start_codon:yes stop_codon:yes gene_type:complete
MTTNDSKVKRLLDGDIDEEEIASDPVLASLAERIFGLNIEPITPTKPSLSDGLPPVEVITAKTSHDSMVEVVPGVEPIPIPMPELPNIPKGEDSKKGKFLMVFGVSSLLLAVANIFGAFGFLNGGEGTRINWAGIHDINNEMGWSEAYPVLGIPDYVAVVASILVLIVAFVRK